MNKWVGRCTDPCRDLEGPLTVSIRLDEDSCGTAMAVATSRAAATEAMRRLKVWVDEMSWLAEGCLEQMMVEYSGYEDDLVAKIAESTTSEDAEPTTGSDTLQGRRDLERPPGVTIRLDADDCRAVTPLVTTRAATTEAILRLKLWAAEESRLAEECLEQKMAEAKEYEDELNPQSGESTTSEDAEPTTGSDTLQVIMGLAPDGSAIVATHPDHAVETKRRLRNWAATAAQEPEIEISEDELRGLANWEIIADWYPGKYDYLADD